jgi:CheY-like chemotaxis protein
MDKILIVDDNIELLSNLKKGLEKYFGQFEVLTATGGQEAIQVLAEQPVSLVVTDIKMPDVDGLTLLAHIAQTYPHLPCIVMTGYRSPQIKKGVDRHDILLHIEKPFHYSELGGAIIKGLDLVDEDEFAGRISLGNICKIIEMEEKTCLLEVHNEQRNEGSLYFHRGKLCDAVCGDGLQGQEAASRMLKWEKFALRFKQLLNEESKPEDNSRFTTPTGDPAQSAQDPISRSPASASVKRQEIEEIDFHELKALKGIRQVAEHSIRRVAEDKKAALVQKLEELEDLKGLLGVGVFSLDGELIASTRASVFDMRLVGSVAADLIQSAQHAVGKIGFSGSESMDIQTRDGINLLVRCRKSSRVDYAVILICSEQTDLGKVRLRLKQIVPNLGDDLK